MRAQVSSYGWRCIFWRPTLLKPRTLPFQIQHPAMHMSVLRRFIRTELRPASFGGTWQLRSVSKMASNAVSCSLCKEESCLELTMPRDKAKCYPYIWLRDNCLCENCFNSVTKSRQLSLQSLPMDATVDEAIIKVSENKDHSLHVTWSDGHESVYPVSWLVERTFPTKGTRSTRAIRYRSNPQLWGTEMQGQIPKFDFSKLLCEDAFLLEWILGLDRVGVCIITGAPKERGQVERFAGRIAFLRSHNYGKVFKVKSKVSPSNAAYTSCALDLHTDLPHYHNPPGTQLFHCIVQAGAGGGESTVCDGFYAAELLRQQHPDYFQILCKAKLDFNDIGEDSYGPFHQLYHGPIFRLDCNGELDMLNYSVHCRDSYMGNVPAEDVITCYKALRAFDDLLNQNKISHLLQPGEILVVDNRRVLHGRKEYTVTPGGQRLLEGGYIDWDHLYSRMRVLAKKLGKV